MPSQPKPPTPDELREQQESLKTAAHARHTVDRTKKPKIGDENPSKPPADPTPKPLAPGD